MSFEFIIINPCRVRKKLGEDPVEVIMNAVKCKGSYHAARDINLKVVPDIKAVDAMEIDWMVRSPDGIKTRKIRLGDMKKQFMKFEKYHKFCRECPCNFMIEFIPDLTVFGCYGQIHYPISGELERILARATFTVIERGEDASTGSFLNYLLQEEDIGKESKRIRRDMPGRILEREEPIDICSQDGNIKVSTDQVFDMLIMMLIAPDYGRQILLPFLDVVTDIILEEYDENEEIANDTSAQEIFHFRRAIEIAGALNDLILASP